MLNANRFGKQTYVLQWFDCQKSTMNRVWCVGENTNGAYEALKIAENVH